MGDSILGRIKHAWNAFNSSGAVEYRDVGPGYGVRPDRPRFIGGNERSIISSVYTRLGMDVAAVPIVHARFDEDKRYVKTIDSGLNQCLSVEANIDQTGRALIQDIAMSMFDEGVIAVVPIDTTLNPAVSSSYDILSMRTGKILQWYPKHVRVRIYNDLRGVFEEKILEKSYVAIIENPLYLVMNEPNSTLKRLIYKLNLLDAIDAQSGSGKLDIIMQLPYVIKTEARKKEAEVRRKALEDQLLGSKYGIGYIDGTEKITQLNRPSENNLMTQIEYLTAMLYSQLGITESIFNGTANENELLNYYNRTIEPILSAIAMNMARTFLTKTGRSQGQSIAYFRDPFKLVAAATLADIADKFTRNEIMSSNEFRGVIGFKPSEDSRADELVNKNISPTTPPSSEEPKAIKGDKNAL